MRHTDTIEQENGRVRLVAASVNDAERLFLAIRPEASKNLAYFSADQSIERQRAYLASIEANDSSLLYVIEEIATERVIGTIGLHEYDHQNRNARLGILIFTPEDRGNGFGTEATKLLFTNAFAVRQLHKLYVRVFTTNAVQLAHYERLGFRTEGMLREEYLLNDKWINMFCMSLLAREWNERSNKTSE
jgi:RimJ/RimL family protein N-acetyltransferase